MHVAKQCTRLKLYYQIYTDKSTDKLPNLSSLVAHGLYKIQHKCITRLTQPIYCTSKTNLTKKILLLILPISPHISYTFSIVIETANLLLTEAFNSSLSRLQAEPPTSPRTHTLPLMLSSLRTTTAEEESC